MSVKVLDQYISKNASIYHADCVEGVSALPSASIDFSCFSPPFESLFTYSASDRDMGNSHGRDEFSRHLAFLAEQMFRVMKPGRIVALHCMDLPTTLQHHGYIGFVDFSARLREVYERAGFIYHCPRVTIWKDPEVQANRTYARQLTYGEMIKDSAMSGIGTPDYILIMRKPGANEMPIAHTSPCKRSGTMAPTIDVDTDGEFRRETCPDCGMRVEIAEDGSWSEHRIPCDELARMDDAGKPRHWQRVASPVWSTPLPDVERMQRQLSFAILRGEKEEAMRLAAALANLYAMPATRENLPPFPEFIWATANGVWIDGFVDYESPRTGNSDKRGIDQGETLNYRAAREDDDERHICPLQIGVVDRLLDLYTRPGEIVLTPFLGIGTEVARAVAKGRRGVGFELKSSYFKQSVEHVKRVEPNAAGTQTALFDLSAEPPVTPAPCACDEPVPCDDGTCAACGAQVAA